MLISNSSSPQWCICLLWGSQRSTFKIYMLTELSPHCFWDKTTLMKKVNILEMQAGGRGVVGQKWNIRIYKCKTGQHCNTKCYNNWKCTICITYHRHVMDCVWQRKAAKLLFWCTAHRFAAMALAISLFVCLFVLGGVLCNINLIVRPSVFCWWIDY